MPATTVEKDRQTREKSAPKRGWGRPAEQTGADTAEARRQGLCFRPRLDIFEEQDAFTIVAEMPGVRSDDLEVKVEKGELTLHGRVHPCGGESCSSVFREYEVGDYYASFAVNGEAVDTDGITAEMADGVLRLRLPKTEAVKPRRIAIKGG